MSTLAERQLAAWRVIAETWPVHLDDRVWRCNACAKGVCLAKDSYGHGYHYGIDQWIALIVLHLRNHHPDLDPDT